MSSHLAALPSHCRLVPILFFFLLLSVALPPSDALLPMQKSSVSNTMTVARQANNDRIETLFPRETTTALKASFSSTTTATTTQRKKGKRSKKRSKKRESGRALTEEELVDHVASKYLLDRGGPLDNESLTRGIYEEHTSADYRSYLGKLNSSPALALNADYQPLSYLPLSLWSWQDAVKAVFNGKVTVVDVYPDLYIRSPNKIEIPVPSVIALNEYVPTTEHNRRPAFTRRNVFLRDEYKCQYCRKRFHTADLSLDHVYPRCMGGVLSWENVVTSCLKCNGKKGSLTTNQLRKVGMKLTRPPFVPSQFELASRASRLVSGQNKKFHSTWLPYLSLGHDQSVMDSSSEATDYFSP